MSKAMVAHLMIDNEAFMNVVGPSPELQAASEPQVGSDVPQQDEGLRDSQSNDNGAAMRTNSSINGKSKPRGLNQLQWGKNGKETLHMNRVGQIVAPRENVVRFSRYLGILARDSRNFSIDAKDWRELDDSKISKVWNMVEATIDWTNPRADGKQVLLKELIREKLNDHFRSWRAKLRRLYYLPFEKSDERTNFKDDRVNQGKWRNLVAHWDKLENKERCKTNSDNRKKLKLSHTTGTMTYAVKRHENAEKHNGEDLDRVTFFTMTHTRGATQLPVDGESARVLAEFKRAEEEIIESGEVVTTEVRNKIFTEMMGPEKRNKVRGYGIRVSWADVLGIVTEHRGISKEVQSLRLATAKAKERINFVRQEAHEAAEKLMEELRAEQEENLRVAKQQMAEQFQIMLARAGINIDMSSMGGHFAQSQQCCSSGSQTTQLGNQNYVELQLSMTTAKVIILVSDI